MSLEVLPDHVLLHVLALLQPCESVAISQTCSRLQRLALQSPGKLLLLSLCPGTQVCLVRFMPQHREADTAALIIAVKSPCTPPGCQGVCLSAVVASAGQRMHVVTGGTWRDALLLSAWQRQQTSATPQRAQRSDSVGSGALHQNTTVSCNRSPLLQQVLGVPDAAAAAIAGDLPSPGGSIRCGAAARDSDVAPAASSTGRRSMTEFGLYWQPGEALELLLSKQGALSDCDSDCIRMVLLQLSHHSTLCCSGLLASSLGHMYAPWAAWVR
jgi:hypothetical protein